MPDGEQKLDTLQQSLKNGERDLTEDDREVLLTFDRKLTLLQTTYGAYRHAKLLRHCIIMAEANPGFHEVPHDRDAAEDVVAWIHRTYSNEETNRDYRSAIRVFGKRLTEGDDVPPTLSWIPTGTSSSYDPSPDPAAMLRWDADVKPMIDAAPNPRDAALIATAFDSGARSGELQSLRVGDVSSGEYGLRILVDGKEGQRSVTLVPAEPYLSRWLGDHPASDDPTAPLWSKLTAPEALSYRRFRDIFSRAASNAGVDKPDAPTHFRKSNASWLARQGANAALIEDRQGRERNSDAVSRYVSRFGPGDESAQYAELHGIDVETGADDELAPIECPRCQRETPHDEQMCVWCGKAVDPVAAETADTVRSSLREAMAREDDPEERAKILSTLERIDSDPEAASELVSLWADEHQGDTSSS
jgi:integrase